MEGYYRLVRGETVTLDDGSDYTNAILEDCRVVYAGGPAHIAGLTLLRCVIDYRGAAAATMDVERARLRGLHKEGCRHLVLNAEGSAIREDADRIEVEDFPTD